MKIIKISLLFLTIIFSTLLSQDFQLDTNYFKINNYFITYLGIDDNLPHLLINSIGEDPNGFLWVSTQEGVVRYNGYKFENLPEYYGKNLLTRNITKIFKDSRNRVWLLPRYQLPVYFENNKFISTKSNITNIHVINDIIEYNKKIIIATNNGLYYIQNGEIKSFNTSQFLNKEILAINIKDDFLYFSTTSSVYQIKLDKNNLIIQNKYDIKYIKQILVRKNDLIFVSFLDGIYIINNNIFHLYEKNGLISNIINYAIVSSNNEIWIATDKGVNRILPNNKILQYTTKEGLSSNIITYIYEDPGKNLWFASLGNNVTLFKPTDFYAFKNKGITNHNVFAVLLHNNYLLAGTYGYGIEVFDNKGKFIKAIKLPGDKENIINSIVKLKNEIWVSTNYGIYRLDNNLNFIEHLKVPKSNLVGSIYYSNYYNKVFLATYFSLYEYDLNKKYFALIKDSLSIFNIVGDKLGNIYLSTENKGIFRYNKGLITHLDFERKITSTTTLFIDRNNNLWFCAENEGLCKYDTKNKLHIVSDKNGLFNNLFMAIEEVGDYLWFSSNQGIFRCKKSEIEDFFAGKRNYITSILYNHKNGIPNSEFNGGYNFASAKSNDNTLFFANADGVVGFSPTKVMISPKAKIVIDEYYANNDILFVRNNNIYLPKNKSNRLELKIQPIIFDNFNHLTIKYKLIGYDDNWRIATSNNIIFTNLNPGTYELLLSLNVDGNENILLKKYYITVEGYFYKKTWFIVLVIITFVLLVIFLFDRIRTRRHAERERQLEKLIEEKTKELIEEKDKVLLAYKEAEKALKLAEEQKKLAEEANKMKTEIVRLVAHDLKNPIGAIQSFASYIFEDIDDDKQYVLEHAKNIKEAADNMLTFVTQLLHMAHLESGMIKPNIRKTSIISLVENVISQNILIASQKAQEIHFTNKLNNEIILCVDPVLTTEIISNYLSNAIKYSPKASHIIVEVELIENKLYISVIDNGPGIMDSEKDKVFGKFQKLSAKPTGGESSHGLGLSIVKLLAEIQQAEVGFESEYGKGSKFFVIFDINKNKESNCEDN